MFFLRLKSMDWAVNGCVVLLAAASMLAVASVAPDKVVQQAIWFGLGAAAMIVVAFVDWRPLVNYRWIIFAIYGAGMLLLIATYFFAPAIRGTRSWFVIGPAQFQPSEIVKAALIILYSYYFARRHIGIAHGRNIVIPLLYALLPAAFIFVQPDLGSVLIIIGLWIVYLLVSGIRWRHIAIGVALGIVLAGIGWQYILKDYQRERIWGLMNPRYDPLGVNYNVIQSKIAVGSGGWLGKGWRQGTQAQLGFLPEAATDFIFAAIAEEWGAVGSAALLMVFMTLIVRILLIGARAENNFSKLICLGTSGLFLLHLLGNVGSALGLVPVVGIPLPLVSYGGSNLLTIFLLLGIVQSIGIQTRF